MQIKVVLLITAIAAVVSAKGNFVCRSFKIDDDCKGKYICVNAYGNCSTNSEDDIDCDCYVKVHRGPF
ncbi:hypothetical protein FBU30_001192 [Linnemannia zychae]|nr:hypothetical protein FBU30_001192 [Linnemannia zychae]